MNIWKYDGDGLFFAHGSLCWTDRDLPEDFGSTEFMDAHYLHNLSLPESDDERRGECPVAGLLIYEVKQEFDEKLPRWVADVRFGDGEILCFDSTWELWDWLSRVMPMIDRVKKWNDLHDPR